ncbi:MAG: DNA-3-methyladenine glycosylase 2 family protein [Selenomonadaceae bacterium]|nr:DNA-3-methyladenine glycosylase 2 family protein [Selenomonadaceae bacterium]
MFFSPNDDFDLEKIATSGQCFRWEKIAGGYRILHDKHSLIIKELGDGKFEVLADEGEFNAIWRQYLDLDENYAKIRERIDAKDDFLLAAAKSEKGIRILRQEPFETLISFIISQNKNIPAIEKSVFLITKYCGEQKRDALGEIYYSFPTPEKIANLDDQILIDCKLGYRAPYVKKAAEAFCEGKINFDKLKKMNSDDAIKELQQLYGVGLKVASCISLFGLHHLNAFPKDVWVKRILAEFYKNGYPYEKYSPYNGIYQQYAFAYYRKLALKEATVK